ncbi:DUF6226 family protein [Nocardioides aurantiacus]|uniref:Uncharacterized protein n=1 Tax=Nocardioides aurantiacus TaxID=86796 RepID=A0A3N2CTX3_9ACTN|nr:DUF6226 family protein [Nocardioides aurantiacus]ROR90961.1 hypothetical protein EDD33_1818 [Nocardioides aurantiacus]
MDDVDCEERSPWFDELVADVDDAFRRTGAGTPGWPNPYADEEPPDETYSRCLDPGKYRILHARVDAWVEVLERRGTATTVDVAATTWVDANRKAEQVARVRRITPTQDQGLPLLVAYTKVDGDLFGVDVGIAQPGDHDNRPVFLDTVPDCGCDHCDSGSEDLLEVLDGWFLTVARGGVVHARAGGMRVTRTLDGWMSSGGGRREDPEALLQPASNASQHWAGETWLSYGTASPS